MINKTIRKKFSKTLKGGYVTDVLVILKKKGIVSRLEIPYTKQYISQVFNGKKSNSDIENAIIFVYENRKEQQKKHVEKIKSL
jgi:hypothetical protein